MEISFNVDEKLLSYSALESKSENINVLAAFNFISVVHAQLRLLQADVLKRLSMRLLKCQK